MRSYSIRLSWFCLRLQVERRGYILHRARFMKLFLIAGLAVLFNAEHKWATLFELLPEAPFQWACLAPVFLQKETVPSAWDPFHEPMRYH
jgi:hypothetical protein